jgi:hypothetical protein
VARKFKTQREAVIKEAQARAERMGMSVDASYLETRYKRLKRQGICVTCADTPAIPTKTQCPKCAHNHRVMQAALRARAAPSGR